MSSTPSDYSDSPVAQPLLQDFDSPSWSKQKKTQSTLSLQLLEDGASDSSSDFGDSRWERRGRPGFWQRLRMSASRKAELKSVRLGGEDSNRRSKFRWRKRWSLVALPLLLICAFGILHLLNFLFGFFPLFSDSLTPSRTWPFPPEEISSHLDDITRNVSPIPCHSHNDYWRSVPLYDALRWGCTGVEADVWLFDEELYVGHSTNALTPDRTFRSMYVDPIAKMLDQRNPVTTGLTTVKNGIFNNSPSTTLVLLVDFKNDGRDIFPYVSRHLNALRERGYLTYFNGEETIEGAVTVVATGNAPFDLITANTTYRDIFFDAPLDRMYEAPNSPKLSTRGGQGTVGTLPTSEFDSTNSYYASVDFRRSIGFVWWSRLSSKQVDLVQGQVRGAHARGLKVRYWSAPKWPVALRNAIWARLVDEGVDYMNGDDLAGMRALLGKEENSK